MEVFLWQTNQELEYYSQFLCKLRFESVDNWHSMEALAGVFIGGNKLRPGHTPPTPPHPPTQTPGGRFSSDPAGHKGYINQSPDTGA